MVNQNIIQTLSYNALKEFRLNGNPYVFALNAAILVATEMAYKESPAAASQATLVATLSFTNKSAITSKWALSELNKRQKDDRVDAWEDIILGIDANKSFEAAKANFINTLGLTNEKHQSALIAAHAYFTLAYTSCYSAYFYASAKAARTSWKSKDDVFQQAMSEWLMRSLCAKPVEPSFLMKAIASDITLYLSITAIVSGLLAMTIGTVLLSVPAAGIAVTSTAGIAALAASIAGGGIAAGSTALMAGRFFAKKINEYEDNKSEHAVTSFLDQESVLNY